MFARAARKVEQMLVKGTVEVLSLSRYVVVLHKLVMVIVEVIKV